MTTCPACSQPLGGDDRFCTGCGKPVTAARALDAPPTSAGAASSGFRWTWALLSIPIALGTAFATFCAAGLFMGLAGFTPDALDADDSPLPEAFGAMVILGSMALAGLVVGWCSPGRTIVEPGVGLAAAVISMAVVKGDTQAVVSGVVLPFLLGACGAWLGEWLQGRFTSR